MNGRERAQEKVFHVAEFSSTGRGEFDVYRNWSEYQSVQKYLSDTSRNRSWLLS